MSKRFVFILSFIFCYGYTCLAQWQWLNPKPSGFINTKMVFTNDQQGFVINDNGDLMATKNQGESWQTVQHFAGKSGIDIKDSTGVIAGNGNTIFISKDNGILWEEKNTNIQENGFNLIDIISRDTFFLANGSGHIYRTDNRGESWAALDCGNTLSAIFFINSKVGYAGCMATSLLKTEDGGATWKAPSTDRTVPWHTRAMFFLDAQTGYIADGDILKKTTDGGKTWGNDFRFASTYHSLYFTSKDTGYAAGEDNAFVRTINAGITWEPLEMPGNSYAYDLNAVYFINNNIGFTAGMRGRILKTTNGGDAWQNYSPDYNDINSLSFPVLDTGYMAIRNTIYKTTDSGDTWLPLALKSDSLSYYTGWFKQSYFASADTGFVTAASPMRVYKTNDGGNSWTKQTFLDPFQNTYDDVYSLSFVNKTTGIINVKDVYAKSYLFKTTNAGSTWQQTGDVSNLYLQHLFFLDEKTGYANNYGTLYKTDDSAKTWKQLYYTNYGVAINSIHFVNEQTGYIVGDLSLLQMTNDSGKTWKSLDVNTLPTNFLAINFYDEKIGHFTTEDGHVFRTSDGGLTWQNEEPLSLGCSIISYSKDSGVYAAGSFGTVVKTSLSKYNIDNIQTDSLSSCSAVLSALVTTVLSRADSLQFEYGITDFVNSIKANPDSIISEQKTITATATGLQPGTAYHLRVKLFYKGKYEYSNAILFTTLPAPAAPVISVNGNATVCSGDSVVLQSSAAHGNQWLLDNTLINDADSSLYVAHISGSYAVVDSAACTSAQSAAVVVTVNSIPAVPTITSSGNVLSSSASTGNQWYRNDSLIQGAANQQYNATLSGNYTIRVSLNGCASPFSIPYNFEVPVTNNNGLFNGEVQYHPNPVSDQLTIQNINNRNLLVSLFTARGNKVKEMQLHSSTGTINIQNLPKGVYILSVTDVTTGEKQSRLVAKE